MVNLSQEAFQQNVGVKINDVHTDIVINDFANKKFILITQYSKLTNIFLAKYENVCEGPTSERLLTIKHKFGTDTDEIVSAMKYLIEQCFPQFSEEIVFSISLKDYEPSNVKPIVAFVKELTQ